MTVIPIVVAWVLTCGFCLGNRNPLLDIINYIETTNPEGCDVSYLSNTVAWCNNTLTKQNTLPEQTLCQSVKEDSDDFICIKHKWLNMKLVGKHSDRFKRSIVDVLIHINQPCELFCNTTSINESLIHHAPTFEYCPSSKVLFPELGLTYVLHAWNEPVANDTDGEIKSLEQIVGPENNTSLASSVSPGTNYVISYLATDNDNLKWTCAFTITSEIPACSPIVHIINGITTCTNFNFRDSTCNVTCDVGYYLNVTFSTVTCEENGTWTHGVENAQCNTVKCTDDPINSGNYTNMQFVCEQNADAFDVVCWSACLSGYTLRNDKAEDDLIAGLQSTLDAAIFLYDNTSNEAQNARDYADQAVIDLGNALELVNISLNYSTQLTQLLEQETQMLESLEQDLNEIQANLSIAQHNLSTAIANNDSSANDLQTLVTTLVMETSNLSDTVTAQTNVVHNLTEDTQAAIESLEEALIALSKAELLVNQTQEDAVLKTELAQQALDAMVAATSMYNDAVLHSTTENKVITSYARCLPNGTWDIPGDPYCTDITQPEIFCVPMVVKYFNQGETSVDFTWSVPLASDNSGYVSVVRISGVVPGTSLSAGQYEVVYQAVDNDDNRSPFCHMLINIEENRCSNVSYLVNDTNMNYACDRYEYGGTCNVSCDFNYEISGPSSFTCELNTISGETPYWNWENPTCTEVVCQLPNAPLNGQIDCTEYVDGDDGNSTTVNGTTLSNGTETLGITCSVICHDGYTLPYNTADVYICENTTGWSSLVFPSMCIESSTEQDASYTLQLSYHTADTCANEDTQAFESDLAAIFGQEVMSYPSCSMGYTCSFGVMNTICTDDVVAVKFSIAATCDNPPNDSGCDLSMDQMSSLLTGINDSVVGGVLTSIGVTLTQDWLSAISSDLPQCPDGSVLVGKYCETCGPGYFYVPSSDACLECGYGSYNHLSGQKSCTTCPENTNTRNRATASLTDCIDECAPGSYSPDGMVPCILCETGTYQDEWGAITCKSCPSDTWTTIAGAFSVDDNCVAYDALFVDAEPNLLLTLVGEEMSIVFWFLNHQQPDISVGLYFSDNNPDDFAFSFKTESNAQLLFNGWDNEPTGIEIQPSVWIMIGMTWDWTTKNLMIYKNGVSAYNTTLDSSIALPDKLIINCNADTVLAGLSVTHSVVTGDEMMYTSQECARKLTGAIYTMDDLSRLRKFNMKHVPTICAESNVTTTDHCDFNACEHSAMCVHNETVGYMCNCTQEYGGPFCEEFLVHGGWSEWIFSTACSVTCGNGTQDRYRLCDNPARSNYGNDCDGNTTETEDCIQNACQECALPVSEGGATCTLQNDTCTPVCPAGYILPTGQNDQQYTCGYTTNYEWLPLTDLPICSEIKKPTGYNCILTFTMNRDVPCSIVESLIASFQAIVNTLQCATNNMQCTVTVSITGCVESRRKREATNSKLVIVIVVDLINTDPMDFTTFYVTSTIDASIQEVVDAITGIEGTVTEIEDQPGILTVNYVDGNLYTVVVTNPATDIIILTKVNCDSGQVPTSGVCAVCQKGTYQIGEYCVYCERGSYQSDPSQTECLLCPQGYTTSNIGARTYGDCYEIPVPAIPPDYTVIIIAVTSCVIVIILAVLIVCLSRRFYLSAKYRTRYDMEADEISLYTDFPDIAYNVYFKRRQVLGFDEDGFPIISKEKVKNGNNGMYSDAEDDNEEDHRTPTPLPKREPFAYPTEYVDPPFTYDPYRNIDSDVLLPEEIEHVFAFPALKESGIRYKVPGRNHLQNAYPLQQFGVKGKVKSRHRKPLPAPLKIALNKKLPQLMYRPPTTVNIDQAVKEQKRVQQKAYATSPREDYQPPIHEHKAPPTLKLTKALDSLSFAIDTRSPRGKESSPRSPKSPRYSLKKGKPPSRGSQRSARSASTLKPTKRYQSILDMASLRPATSASVRSLKSALSTHSKSVRPDSPKSVSINLQGRHEDDDAMPHPKPSRITVPKLNIRFPSKSLLKNTSSSYNQESRPDTGRKSVIFQEEGKLTRPSTSAARIDDGAPSSASKSARATIVAPNSSRHKPPYKPYDSDIFETYRPDSYLERPDSPLYRPVSSSTRASSPTFHPKPVIHKGTTVQRRSDFVMYNPPPNLSFKTGMPPVNQASTLMRPPAFFNKVSPREAKSTTRASQMSVKFEDSDDEEDVTGSFFLTEIPASHRPSRASVTLSTSGASKGGPLRTRRASKVRFKKDSPPPAYTEAEYDPVIEKGRFTD